jgi:hypothetical protein
MPFTCSQFVVVPRALVPVGNLIWLAKTENRAMLLCHEGYLQAYWLDGRRSDPLREQRLKQRFGRCGSKSMSCGGLLE